MKLEGIHHITAITGDAPAQRRLLRARARPADGQEDRQPGRPDRLPPVLRRRERLGRRGPDVLRVPGRARAAGGRGHGPPDRPPRRLGRVRSTSGPTGWAPRGSTTSRVDGGLRFADPEGLEHELRVVDVPGRAARRALAPRCRRSTRCRASTPSTRRWPTRAQSEALLTERHGLRGPRRAASSRRAAASRGGSIVLRAGGAGRGFGGAGTVHHIAWASTHRRARGLALARRSRRARTPRR